MSLNAKQVSLFSLTTIDGQRVAVEHLINRLRKRAKNADMIAQIEPDPVVAVLEHLSKSHLELVNALDEAISMAEAFGASSEEIAGQLVQEAPGYVQTDDEPDFRRDKTRVVGTVDAKVEGGAAMITLWRGHSIEQQIGIPAGVEFAKDWIIKRGYWYSSTPTHRYLNGFEPWKK